MVDSCHYINQIISWIHIIYLLDFFKKPISAHKEMPYNSFSLLFFQNFFRFFVNNFVFIPFHKVIWIIDPSLHEVLFLCPEFITKFVIPMVTNGLLLFFLYNFRRFFIDH
uniref:Uncharacterized protein n=1 Tax=Cacopsylla melanoneura TaxID=428564 RepID=A0A8D9AI63_9HEMI